MKEENTQHVDDVVLQKYNESEYSNQKQTNDEDQQRNKIILLQKKNTLSLKFLDEIQEHIKNFISTFDYGLSNSFRI